MQLTFRLKAVLLNSAVVLSAFFLFWLISIEGLRQLIYDELDQSLRAEVAWVSAALDSSKNRNLPEQEIAGEITQHILLNPRKEIIEIYHENKKIFSNLPDKELGDGEKVALRTAELCPFCNKPAKRIPRAIKIKSGGAFMYPLVAEGILNVDQIVWEREQRLAVLQPRSLTASIAAAGKKYFLDPLLFLIMSSVLLLAPQRLLHVFSHGHAHILLRQMMIRSFDVAGAAMGPILALPFFLFVPLLIKLDSPGPIFYRQIRTGRDRSVRKSSAS